MAMKEDKHIDDMIIILKWRSKAKLLKDSYFLLPSIIISSMRSSPTTTTILFVH